MAQQNIGNRLKQFFGGKTLLSTLIAANVAVWLFMLLFGVIEFLFALGSGTANSVWYDWFALSSDLGHLLRHPWTPLTYMFLHANFWHLLFNMVMLYAGGLMCCRYMGMKRFGWTYFVSGVAGAAVYLLCYNIFPAFYYTTGQAVGASAAVLGVLVAVATYMPEQEVGLWPLPDRLRIKLKWLAIALVVIDLMSIPKGNAGGHIAHIGGMLYGFLSVWLPRQKVFDNAQAKQRRAERKRRRQQERQRRKAAKKQPRNTAQRPLTDEEYNRRKSDNQKRIDAILDKISKSGYDSLSKEEKEILFNYK